MSFVQSLMDNWDSLINFIIMNLTCCSVTALAPNFCQLASTHTLILNTACSAVCWFLASCFEYQRLFWQRTCLRCPVHCGCPPCIAALSPFHSVWGITRPALVCLTWTDRVLTRWGHIIPEWFTCLLTEDRCRGTGMASHHVNLLYVYWNDIF